MIYMINDSIFCLCSSCFCANNSFRLHADLCFPAVRRQSSSDVRRGILMYGEGKSNSDCQTELQITGSHGIFHLKSFLVSLPHFLSSWQQKLSTITFHQQLIITGSSFAPFARSRARTLSHLKMSVFYYLNSDSASFLALLFDATWNIHGRELESERERSLPNSIDGAKGQTMLSTTK